MTDEFYHYGVLGMKWGVRKNPSQAYTKASRKLTKLKQKAAKKQVKATKKKLKADKVALRRVSWGPKPSNQAVLKRAKQAAKATRKANISAKKAAKWENAMLKEFSNIKITDLDKSAIEAGKDYTWMLMHR